VVVHAPTSGADSLETGARVRGPAGARTRRACSGSPAGKTAETAPRWTTPIHREVEALRDVPITRQQVVDERSRVQLEVADMSDPFVRMNEAVDDGIDMGSCRPTPPSIAA